MGNTCKIFALVCGAIWLTACTTTPPEKPTTVPPTDKVTPPVEVPKDPPPVVDTKPATFEVSQEKYQATFKEIEALITELNTIIQERHYEVWKTYLDDNYIKVMSDPAYLKKNYGDSPILKKYSIKLTTLKDYFDFAVGPSRANAKLDEILFLDESRVIAYMYIKNEKTILYQLRFDGKRWKISLW